MGKLNNAIKNQIVTEYLKTPGGRAKIAAAMSSPLRKRRDYQAVGRKAFLVEDIPDGVYAIYDRDPEVEAYVLGEEGENIIRVTRPERVFVPTFELAANPEIPLSQARQRRYDLVNRALTLGKVAINEQEDLRVVGVFNAAAGATNPNIAATAPITPAIMSDAFAGVETSVVGTGLGGGTIGDNTVTKVFWNGRDYTDIRKFGRDIYDPETQALVLKTGVKGYIWGAQMIIARFNTPTHSI